MGLDNGITVRAKTQLAVDMFEDYFNELHLNTTNHEELCYWRKCQGIRADILDIAHVIDDEGWEYTLTLADLQKIVNILASYLTDPNKDWWSVIWDRVEMVSIVTESLRTLCKFLEVVREWSLTDDDFEIIFYDSYQEGDLRSPSQNLVLL